MTDKKEGVQVTIPAETMNDGQKVDLVVEAENVVVNQPMERNGEAAGAKAMADEDMPADLQAVMDENKEPAPAKPKTKKVKTGTNVLTGKDVVKDVPVVEERDYSKGRTLYTAHSMISGSYNGRRINLSKGGDVYLDENEYEIFKPYVNAK